MKNALIIASAIIIAGIVFAAGQQVTTPGQVALVCAYNTTPTSVTTGNFVLVQCDTHGYLLTKTAP